MSLTAAQNGNTGEALHLNIQVKVHPRGAAGCTARFAGQATLRLTCSRVPCSKLPTCASRMANQSCWALITRLVRPSLSYFTYNVSKASPQQSASPGASLGQKRLHSAWQLGRSVAACL